MEETMKETCTNLKAKNPRLDKDVGKDFLASWKSMSLTEDDPMAFNFDTVPDGKKSFNFEKMDMDFNLDGDFGKLSSFKVDMPDFDFSSPSKSISKSKDKSQDDSTGSLKMNKEHFATSFDFGLGTFDLDSALMKKEGETSNKSLNPVKSASDENKEGRTKSFNFVSSSLKKSVEISGEIFYSKVAALIRNDQQSPLISEVKFINDSICVKQSASEVTNNSELEMEQEDPAKCRHTRETTYSEPELISTASKKKLSPITKEAEYMTSLELQPSETSQIDCEETNSDVHREICTLGDKVCRAKENIDNEMTPTVGSNQVSVAQKKSLLIPTDTYVSSKPEHQELVLNTQADKKERMETAKTDLDVEDTSTVVLSGEGSPYTCANQEFVMQNSSSNIPPATSSIKHRNDNAKAMDNSDTGTVHGRFLNIPKQIGSHIPQPSSSRLEGQSFCGESVSCITNMKSADDAKVGCKSAGYSKALNVNLSKATHDSSGKNVASLSNNRGGLKNVKASAKLLDSAKLQDKHLREGKFVLVIDEKDYSSQANASSPNKKTGKHLASIMETLQKSKISSLERLKVGKSIPDLLTIKTTRTTEANKEAHPLTNLDQNAELSGNKSSQKLHRAIRIERQMLQTPSLKRKIEEPSTGLASLKPLKRLSISPSETRNWTGFLEKVEEKVLRQQNDATCNGSDGGSEALKGLNLTEMEMHLVMENDVNIKKAEAYTKELENICNMLRKKHEEANELLVRAIVNNNNLLMLSHPMYDQKIHTVQKFAEKLMSEENAMASAATTVYSVDRTLSSCVGLKSN